MAANSNMSCSDCSTLLDSRVPGTNFIPPVVVTMVQIFDFFDEDGH